MKTTALLTLLSVFVCVKNCSAEFDSDELEDQILIVLSLDAFQPKYFELGITPNMEAFRQQGSFSPYLKPTFPTKTFVNHFSIGTG